jgi:hypothetical protein
MDERGCVRGLLYSEALQFDQRTALVTGAAPGIGAAVAVGSPLVETSLSE